MSKFISHFTGHVITYPWLQCDDKTIIICYVAYIVEIIQQNQMELYFPTEHMA